MYIDKKYYCETKSINVRQNINVRLISKSNEGIKTWSFYLKECLQCIEILKKYSS